MKSKPLTVAEKNIWRGRVLLYLYKHNVVSVERIAKLIGLPMARGFMRSLAEEGWIKPAGINLYTL